VTIGSIDGGGLAIRDFDMSTNVTSRTLPKTPAIEAADRDLEEKLKNVEGQAVMGLKEAIINVVETRLTALMGLFPGDHHG